MLLPTRELHEFQTRNRLDQQTRLWQQRYAIRGGIEATLSQNVRAYGLRRSRYRGVAGTHVQHVLTASACNRTRIADWIATPPTTRRRSTYFHALCTGSSGHCRFTQYSGILDTRLTERAGRLRHGGPVCAGAFDFVDGCC
ncbi:transposase [Streptomyces sp. NPDC016566]|uniref:transposase n=1 Tax=Streptomyces sp. NPDC016566 TaxID=3364967 RepID=UPI0036FD10D0